MDALGLVEPILEFVDGEARRVNDASRCLAQMREGMALRTDPIEHAALTGERMAPPRLVVSPDQGLVSGFEEQHLDTMAASAQGLERVDEMRQVLAFADVDAERDL